MTDALPTTKGNSPSLPDVFDGEIYQQVGRYARGAVLFAFEQMGGASALTDWATENKDEFYTKLFPKIIARESEVHQHHTIDQLSEMLDSGIMIEDAEVIDDAPVFDKTPMGSQEGYRDEPVRVTSHVTPPIIAEHAGEDLVDFEE